MIEANKPKLWICGHTHESFFGKIDKTLYYINPIGYLDNKGDILKNRTTPILNKSIFISF